MSSRSLSPVVYFAVLAYRFAPRGVVLLSLLDAHDIPQLGACQFPVFVLCLKTKDYSNYIIRL